MITDGLPCEGKEAARALYDDTDSALRSAI